MNKLFNHSNITHYIIISFDT